MWKCGNTWSLLILISRAAYSSFLINPLLNTLLFDYHFYTERYTVYGIRYKERDENPARYRTPDTLYPTPFLSVVTAKRIHPFPFRTRKLSSSAPMVLHGQLCGRVGHRRFLYIKSPEQIISARGFFFVLDTLDERLQSIIFNAIIRVVSVLRQISSNLSRSLLWEIRSLSIFLHKESPSQTTLTGAFFCVLKDDYRTLRVFIPGGCFLQDK